MSAGAPAGRSWVAWLRLIGVLIALAVSGAARWDIARGQRWADAMTLLVGGAVVAAILLGKPQAAAAAEAAGSVAAPGGRRMRRVLGVTFGVLGLAALAFAVYLLAASWSGNFELGAPLFVAGVVLVSLGLSVWDEHHAGDATLPMAGWERWLFLAVLLLGFFLRFYQYDTYPPPDGFCAVEEPQTGLVAHHMLLEGQRPWEFLLDRWMAVASFALFGVSITALRIPFTVVSGLTMIPLHLLLRQLVSPAASLFATALFAMCRWDLINGRCAHPVFSPAPLVILIFFLCMRAHTQRRLSSYPWIGFLTACTLYAYAGYRGTSLFVFIFFAISVLAHLLDWRRAVSQEARSAARRVVTAQVAGLLVAVVTYAATALPLAVLLRGEPSYFVEAARRSAQDRAYYSSGAKVFTARFREAVSLFNYPGHEVTPSIPPLAPMIDPLTSVLLTVGLAYAVVWGRHRFQGYFAGIFIFLFVAGTVLVHNYDIRRLGGIIALIFVLIAFVVDRLAQVVTARFGKRARAVLVVLAVAAAGFSLADNYRVYFQIMMHDPQVLGAYQNRHTVLLRYLHAMPDGAYVVMVTDVPNVFLPSDFEWWRGDRISGQVTSDLLPILTGERGPWTGRDLRVLIQEPFDREGLVRLLRERFRGISCEVDPRSSDYPPVRYTACTIPSVVDPDGFQGGAHARYFRGTDTEPLVDRMEPVISYGLFPDVCRAPVAREGTPPCRAEWEGTWTVGQSGVYGVAPEVRQGEIDAAIDGQPIREGVRLDAGSHVVTVQARFRSIEEPGAQLRWRRSTTNQWELVRFARLQPVHNDAASE